MYASSFEESNCVLSAPPGMEAEVDSLSVYRGTDTNGAPVVVSCFKATAAELEEIKRTGRVWLIVSGQTMPPVAIVGENPFGQAPREENPAKAN